MFCSNYLRGRAWSLASHQMFFAGDRPAPDPRTLGGSERGRALNRGPITPDRRRAQPQRPPVLAARDLRSLIGLAPITLPRAVFALVESAGVCKAGLI